MRCRSNVFQLSAFLIVIGAGMAGIGLATTVPQMVAAVVVHQIGTGMAVPTLIAWAQTKFPFEHRGRGMGLWSSAFFLGQFASPIIIHQFAGVSGSMRGGFLVAGLVSVVFAIALVILMPMLTRRHAAAIAMSARD